MNANRYGDLVGGLNPNAANDIYADEYARRQEQLSQSPVTLNMNALMGYAVMKPAPIQFIEEGPRYLISHADLLWLGARVLDVCAIAVLVYVIWSVWK